MAAGIITYAATTPPPSILRGPNFEMIGKQLSQSGSLESNKDEAKAPSPGYAEQQKRERTGKEELDRGQSEMQKTIDDYKNNSGDPNGSNNRGGDPKGGIIAKIIGGAAAIGGIIEQLSNPDPSKDAHEAHATQAQQKEPQDKNDPTLLQRILNLFNE